ncbi:hypothetical protein AWZ03_000653 [Drosophila navojoa]|uniref:Uncharacterized protein n=1 Tax=Drosophila navojoa TaxID=7232 RepID=A0A484BYW8_DRONA|nr:hypothetical protein AWZ03_000653 [Drosophila navojoa]
MRLRQTETETEDQCSINSIGSSSSSQQKGPATVHKSPRLEACTPSAAPNSCSNFDFDFYFNFDSDSDSHSDSSLVSVSGSDK